MSRDVTRNARDSNSEHNPRRESSRIRSARPAFLDYTEEQKDIHAVAVLRAAFHLIVLTGWCRPYALSTIGNGPTPPGTGLIEAIQCSSRDGIGIDCHWARCVIQRLEFFIQEWEAHPRRTQEEVLRLLAKSISVAGGEAPSIPAAPNPKRRGGWCVSPEVA